MRTPTVCSVNISQEAQTSARHTAEDLDAVAATLNRRPRKTLGWRTPAEALDKHLRSLQTQTIATTD